MSQMAVERVLGKLVTDEAFRAEFFAAPARAVIRAGLELTDEELAALQRTPRAALARLCARLDDRICRLYVAADSEPRGGQS